MPCTSKYCVVYVLIVTHVMCVPVFTSSKAWHTFNSGNRIRVGRITAPDPAIADQGDEQWCPAIESEWAGARGGVELLAETEQFTGVMKRAASHALSYRDPTQNDICPGYSENAICLTFGGTESLNELFHCRPCQAIDGWISIEANWNGKKGI